MKKSLFLFFLLFSMPVTLEAGTKNTTGMGIIIGPVSGINVKHFFQKDKNALEGDFSVVNNKLYLTLSYLGHYFDKLPSVEEGKLPIFYGPVLAFYENNLAFGGTFGATYLFKDYPFDIFMKLSPLLVLEKNIKVTLTGGIGGRYFFK